VPETSRAVAEKVRDLDAIADEHDVEILGLVRRGQRLPGRARRAEIRKNDVLVLHADARGIEAMVGALGLEYRTGDSENQGVLEQEGESFLEVVVPQGSRFDGRSADSLRLRYRHDVMLLGVSRQGSRFTDRVRHLKVRAGDVLLLLGTPQRLEDVCARLGCMPLAPTAVQPIQRQKAGLAALVFGCAVLAAGAGIVYLPIALGMAAVVMIMTGIVPLRQVYDAVEWPVIVLLGSMIPLGVALETSGGTAMLASAIVDLTTGLPAFAVLAALMIVTMTLSDVMNNVATAVIAAPIALGIASGLGVNPDAFLMGVAVASSCAFLTPIGHKNNTLILGPGGYRFSDFWRMGLPLEILVLLVGIPMILWVWPL
jgi:di/tricarboxylate transporter